MFEFAKIDVAIVCARDVVMLLPEDLIDEAEGFFVEVLGD